MIITICKRYWIILLSIAGTNYYLGLPFARIRQPYHRLLFYDILCRQTKHQPCKEQMQLKWIIWLTCRCKILNYILQLTVILRKTADLLQSDTGRVTVASLPRNLPQNLSFVAVTFCVAAMAAVVPPGIWKLKIHFIAEKMLCSSFFTKILLQTYAI